MSTTEQPENMSSDPHIHNLCSLLMSLTTSTQGETVSVADLLDAVGRRTFGPVLLLLGFISVSPLTIVPGANWLIAFVTLLIAGQVVLGFHRPWLPKRALAVEFPRSALIAGVKAAHPTAAFVDKIIKPRICFLTAAPFLQLVAVIAILAALVTFPLGFIPFGPVLPGFAIMFIGLGVTARDGIMVFLACGALVGSGFLVVEALARIF